MKKEQYKVVIVGFAHVHINDVAQHFYDNPRIDLAACADLPPKVAEMRTDAPYTRQWNLKYCSGRFSLKVYEDWIEMLEKEQPDLVVCNSENCYHVKVTEECARRGIAVCIEKPMATTLKDAMEMYRLAKAHHSLLMVNWPITWYAAMHTAKKMLEDGVIGDLIEVKTRMGHTGPLGPGAQHAGVSEAAAPMSGPERGASWWHQDAAGGGALLDYCCYGAMVTRWYIGEQATDAVAMAAGGSQTRSAYCQPVFAGSNSAVCMYHDSPFVSRRSR